MRLLLFLLLAATLRAQIPGTTLIPAPIAPPATNSDFGSVESIFIKGGTWTGVGDVSWLTDTNRYPMGRRDAGQLAILTDQSIFQLGPDLTTWAPLTLSGGPVTNMTGGSLYGETYIENGKIDTATFKNGASLAFDQMDSFKAGKVDNASSQLFMVQQTPLIVTNVATLLATPKPARGRAAIVLTGEWKGNWLFCPDETEPDNGTTIRRPNSVVTDGEAGRWVFQGASNYAQGLASMLGLTGIQSTTYYPLNQRTAGTLVTMTNGAAYQLAADLTTWSPVTFGGGAAYNPYIYKSAAAVSFANTVAETSLFVETITIPGGVLTEDGEFLEVNIPLKFSNNSGANRSVTIRVKIGGVTVFEEATATFPAAAPFRIGALKVNVMRRSATTAAGGVHFSLSSTTAATIGLGDFAVASTQAIGGFEGAAWTWANVTSFDVTATFSNATATIQMDTYGATIRK